jgi:hypothetical protein
MKRAPPPLALALVLAACAPLVDLPQPKSPFEFREFASYPSGPLPPGPDPNGPCVQSTHRHRRSHTWWWKNGQLVAGGQVAATADHAPAQAIARSARSLNRAFNGLLHGGMALLVASMATFSGLEATRGDWTGPAAVGIGAAVVAPMIAVSIRLMLRGALREQQATKVYNTWAAEHGCSDPSPQATTSSQR